MVYSICPLIFGVMNAFQDWCSPCGWVCGIRTA
jgi:hypothetical protein